MRVVREIGIAGILLAGLGLTAGLVRAAVGAAAEPTGTIRAECERFRLTVLTGSASREIVGEKGRATVPAGSYFILHSETEFADRAGRVWRVRNGIVETPVVVRAGQTTLLTLGAPLETRLGLRLEEGKLIAEGQFWGPLGDHCEGVVVEGGALPAPRVRILDQDGKELARPEGSYCCKFTASIVWPLPAGLSGRLRVVPDIPLGPLAVWTESAAEIEVGK